jgi:hypothetical protein
MNENLPAAQQSQSREHAEYNQLFDKLITEAPEDEPSLIGFICYAYYKIAKREYVGNFFEKNARHPDESEMRVYIASWTDSRIEGLKTEANTVLSEFSSYIIGRERPKIVEEVLKHRSFIRDALVAFSGAFFYSIALLLFALVLHFFDIDVLHVLGAVK